MSMMLQIRNVNDGYKQGVSMISQIENVTYITNNANEIINREIKYKTNREVTDITNRECQLYNKQRMSMILQ